MRDRFHRCDRLARTEPTRRIPVNANGEDVVEALDEIGPDTVVRGDECRQRHHFLRATTNINVFNITGLSSVLRFRLKHNLPDPAVLSILTSG